MDMGEFIKDRNEAFISMDKDKIIAYCKKYNVKIPEDETIFWAGVHKALCNMYFLKDSPVNKKQYDESYIWLAQHGYGPLITGGDE